MWPRSELFGSILGSVLGLVGINAIMHGINANLFIPLVIGFIIGGLVGVGIEIWGSKRPVLSGIAFTTLIYGAIMACLVLGGGGQHLHSVTTILGVIATTVGIGAMSGFGYKILSRR